MQTINRVLINSVTTDLASNGILDNFILKFKENEYLKIESSSSRKSSKREEENSKYVKKNNKKIIEDHIYYYTNKRIKE